MKFNSICIKTAQQMKSPKIWAFLVVLPKKTSKPHCHGSSSGSSRIMPSINLSINAS